MYVHIDEHKNSKENKEEIPLLTRHNYSEGEIIHFLCLFFFFLSKR